MTMYSFWRHLLHVVGIHWWWSWSVFDQIERYDVRYERCRICGVERTPDR